MKISPRFGISSLLFFVLICAAIFAWQRPFEPEVQMGSIRAEQHHGTLKGGVIRVALLVRNRSENTLWFAANEHGLIPSEVMLTGTENRNGEEKRFYIPCDTSFYVPYDTNEQSERKKWLRVSPHQTIELHTVIRELPNADEFVMTFDFHDWRGHTANVRTPVFTVAELLSGPENDD